MVFFVVMNYFLVGYFVVNGFVYVWFYVCLKLLVWIFLVGRMRFIVVGVIVFVLVVVV